MEFTELTKKATTEIAAYQAVTVLYTGSAWYRIQ